MRNLEIRSNFVCDDKYKDKDTIEITTTKSDTRSDM